MPEFAARETGKRKRFPRALPSSVRGYSVLYRRPNWCSIGWNRGGVHHRDTFVWILKGERRVGAMEIVEVKTGWVENEEIADALDSLSASDDALGRLLVGHWDVFDDLTSYGPVIELRNVWLERRHAKPGVWIPIALKLLKQVFADRSIVVGQLFPIEYAGRAPDFAPSLIGFNRRMGAMRRYFGRKLGVKPFPGQAGKDGWMWAPRPDLAEIIEEPEPRSDPFG